MNETNALSLTQENHPVSNRALSENEDSAPLPEALLLAIEATASTGDTGRTRIIRTRNGAQECGPVQTGSRTF